MTPRKTFSEMQIPLFRPALSLGAIFDHENRLKKTKAVSFVGVEMGVLENPAAGVANICNRQAHRLWMRFSELMGSKS
jgi:hypothetical protein